MVLWPMLFAGLTTCRPADRARLSRAPRAARDAGARRLGAGCCRAVASLVGTAIGWQLIPLWLSHHPPEVDPRRPVLPADDAALFADADRAGGVGGAGRVRLVVAVAAADAARASSSASACCQWRGALTPVSAAAIYVLAGPAEPRLDPELAGRRTAVRPSTAAGALWGRLSHYGLRSYGVDLCGILAVYLDQALVVGLLSAVVDGHLRRRAEPVARDQRRARLGGDDGLPAGRRPRAGGDGRRRRPLRAAGDDRRRPPSGWRCSPPDRRCWRGSTGRPTRRPAHILPILVAEAIVAGLAQVLLQGFLAAGRPGVATMVLGLGLAGSVPLFLVLVPAFGVVGAAIALLGGSSLRVLLHGAGLPLGAAAAGAAPCGSRGEDLVDLARYRGALVSLDGAAARGGRRRMSGAGRASSHRLHRASVGAAHRSPAARRRAGLVRLRAAAGRARSRGARRGAARRHPLAAAADAPRLRADAASDTSIARSAGLHGADAPAVPAAEPPHRLRPGAPDEPGVHRAEPVADRRAAAAGARHVRPALAQRRRRARPAAAPGADRG